ncbi:MAG: flagellar biosynthetic protein FliR, partial [Geminicoccaceae bacterium]|nr:flagellar biosynthetic protein FliR [Geminicoccaceae bacterium]
AVNPLDLVRPDVLAPWVVFARLGAAFLLLPGFAETYVTPRLRLATALFSSLLVTGSGLVAPPPLPSEPARLAALILGEIAIGLAIGVTARFALAAVHLAGTLVATNSGLAAAALFDPGEATPGTLPGAFLSSAFLALLFTSDAHHALLRRLVGSYDRLPVGEHLWIADAAELLARLGSELFATGLAMAAPLLAVALLANLALGVLARLVPALQILFVALPLQLLLALAALAVSFGASLLLALRFLERATAWTSG